eukprot:15355202-Alexandrium_andersonii.AAC.1
MSMPAEATRNVRPAHMFQCVWCERECVRARQPTDDAEEKCEVCKKLTQLLKASTLWALQNVVCKVALGIASCSI